MPRTYSKYGVYKKNFETEREYAQAYQRAYRASDAGRAYTRKANLKKYGVTPEWYDIKLAEQQGRCAVCGTNDPGRNQYNQQCFTVDHNHITGKVRGLLCHNCNRAEGLLQGNAQRLADYLKEYDE